MMRAIGGTLLAASAAVLLAAAAYAADVKATVNACQTFRDSVFQGCSASCAGARCLNGCSKRANDEFNSCLSATNLNKDATGGR